MCLCGQVGHELLLTEPNSQAPGACDGPSELGLGGKGAGPLESRGDVIDEDFPGSGLRLDEAALSQGQGPEGDSGRTTSHQPSQ